MRMSVDTCSSQYPVRNPVVATLNLRHSPTTCDRDYSIDVVKLSDAQRSGVHLGICQCNSNIVTNVLPIMVGLGAESRIGSA